MRGSRGQVLVGKQEETGRAAPAVSASMPSRSARGYAAHESRHAGVSKTGLRDLIEVREAHAIRNVA